MVFMEGRMSIMQRQASKSIHLYKSLYNLSNQCKISFSDQRCCQPAPTPVFRFDHPTKKYRWRIWRHSARATRFATRGRAHHHPTILYTVVSEGHRTNTARPFEFLEAPKEAAPEERGLRSRAFEHDTNNEDRQIDRSPDRPALTLLRSATTALQISFLRRFGCQNELLVFAFGRHRGVVAFAIVVCCQV